MFGKYISNNKPPADKDASASGPLPDISKPSDSSKRVSDTTGFDPTMLERAAKAAKDLDSSKNSKDVVSMILAQEHTRQKELELERAKYMAHQQQLAKEKVHQEEEASHRTLERKAEYDKMRAEYQDQLERKRSAEMLDAQRQINDEERRKNEESLARQETIRRKTLEHEAELRQKSEAARAKAEAEGRILQERENHDLIVKKRLLELNEQRKIAIESIQVATGSIGKGIQDFIKDKEILSNTVLTVTALFCGYYSARVGAGVVGRYVESRLGKPSLVRETSRVNTLQFVTNPLKAIRNINTNIFGREHALDALKGVVLEPALEQRLKSIALSTANTKANSAPYRHLLFHGPPGTGKTMFAKGLAKDSGMDYAIMTGGDIAPLGKDAVTEIHNLFDWAHKSRKGVVIFVDEADAFLRKRSTEKISEDMRSALNAFLYRTGEASKRFMIVYASNQPEQFDWAINDRIDELVEFGLPEYDERVKMITQYIEDYLNKVRTGKWPYYKKIQISEDVGEDLIQYFAKESDGFSGREISKLAIAWQAAAFGNKNAVIDAQTMKDVFNNMKKNKSLKLSWLTKSQIN